MEIIKMHKAKGKPWESPKPKKGKSKKLTPEQKALAQQRAREAGRPYPNLIDNMCAAGH